MSVNAAGDKIIPFKIKEADIEDAKTSDIKNICKKKRSQELPNGTHPEPLSPIHENPYKVVEFYNKWKKVIPEQFRAVACPEPTPEQYAAGPSFFTDLHAPILHESVYEVGANIGAFLKT